MKKIFNILMVGLCCSVMWGCTKDNVAAPDGVISGKIIDASTGQPIQIKNGDASLYALQTSYTKGTPIPFSYYIQQGGTYINTKVFAGTYTFYPQKGPFVPLVYNDAKTGALIDNGSKSVVVKSGETTMTDFTVTPFLKVDWVGEPVLNADGTVTVKCTFVRGTTDPLWIFNVTDVFFFISNTPILGGGTYDTKLSTQVNYTGTAGNDLLGKTVTITSKAPLGLHQGYYLRVGSRTADNQSKVYNFTNVKAINIP